VTKGTTQAKEPKLFTAKELADMAGIPPTALRRILRKHFNGVGKAKVDGDDKEHINRNQKLNIYGCWLTYYFR